MTSIAPPIAEYLQVPARIPGGRRAVPGDAGMVIVRTLRLHSLAVATTPTGWLPLTWFGVAVTYRPQVLGVGGMLGADFLARFRRITFEVGPPDALILEADDA